MVEEGRDVATLPDNDTCNSFGVMWVYKDVVIMQIIMPDAWVGDGGVRWGKGIDDPLVRC